MAQPGPRAALRDGAYVPDRRDIFDYFHLNSVCVDHDGGLVVSARPTSTIYKLDRTTGAVVWRLGGTASDFSLPAGGTFEYQHHARTHPGGVVTVFDNASFGGAPAEPVSRALALRLDERARTAAVLWSIADPANAIADKMGAVEPADGSTWFVSWGDLGRFIRHTTSGDAVFAAALVGGGYTYRAVVGRWRGTPAGRPNVTAVAAGAVSTIYVSWNGATEVASLQVLGGPTAAALRPLKTVPRVGFETAIELTAPPRVVAVAALDANGALLATSRTLRTAS